MNGLGDCGCRQDENKEMNVNIMGGIPLWVVLAIAAAFFLKRK